MDLFVERDFISDDADVLSNLEYGNYDNCKAPLISIIMPVYQRPEFLRIALASVLEQETELEYEVVIVDNNEDNPSPNLSVVKDFNASNVFYYHHEKNLGMYGNFNRGVKLARGKYLTFCHDDDSFVKTTLETLISIKRKVGSECIIGEHNTINEEGKMINTPNYPESLMGLFRRKSYFHYSLFDFIIKCPGLGGGGCLFDKDKMIELGGFNPEWYPITDYVFVVRYASKYGAIQIPAATYNYREAVNASYQVANKFQTMNRQVHNEIKKYVRIPSFIMNYIIGARYRIAYNYTVKNWNLKDQYKKVSLFDKMVIKALNVLVKMKAYV